MTTVASLRDGGNFVQPEERRDGTKIYVVYVAYEPVDTFEEEWAARNCLLGHFDDQTTVTLY